MQPMKHQKSWKQASNVLHIYKSAHPAMYAAQKQK
uniref:Uncharacterized protein n=1 Tax=Rhizophora mucronata TaxID=61149 RepID=A0A2P2PX75_RHIMU